MNILSLFRKKTGYWVIGYFLISFAGAKANDISSTTITLPAIGSDFSPTRSIAFSSDGKSLAVSGDDGLIRIWDVSSKKLRRVLMGKSGKVSALCYSNNGKWLASATSACTNLWDAQTGKLIRRFRIYWRNFPDEFYAVSFSSDNKFIATGSGGNGRPFQVVLWNVKSGKLIKSFQGHQGKIKSVSFSPNGKLLLSASYDRTLRLWDTQTGKTVSILRSKAPYFKAIFSPDGKTIALCQSDGTIETRNSNATLVLRRFSGKYEPIKELTFSRDGTRLSGGSGDGNIVIWAVNTGQRIGILKSHRLKTRYIDGQSIRNDIVGIAFHPDGTLLASASYDGWIQLWKIK